MINNYLSRSLEWNVHTMTTGHDVMITSPSELAEILLRIVYLSIIDFYFRRTYSIVINKG